MHLEIGNAFAKFLEMHFQKLKMHLKNPWKCICKTMEIHGNAFKKPKLEMHFFSRVDNGDGISMDPVINK